MKRLAKLRKRYNRIVKAYTVTRIHLNTGGYDSYGRYYGRGKPLYEVTNTHTNETYTVRASSATSARAKALRGWKDMKKVRAI